MDDHKTIDLTLIPKSLTLKRAASYSNLYTTLLAASLLGSLIPSSASARTFRVVTLADAPAPPLTVAECGDLPEPTCTSTLPSAECTLRAAVQWANNCPGHDTIQLDAPGGGTYSLTVLNGAGGAEDNADRGDLDVTEQVRIVGMGTSPTAHIVDGLNADRVFHAILPLLAAPDTGEVSPSILTLENMTVQNGTAQNGGCIYAVRPPGTMLGGAGLLLDTALVRSCTATNDGGAIHMAENTYKVEGVDSTIRDSTATANGGGIYSKALGVEFLDSVFTMNSAGADGGGVFAVDAGQTVGSGFDHFYQGVEFIGNTAGSDGGAIYSEETPAGAAAVPGRALSIAFSDLRNNAAGTAFGSSAGGAVYSQTIVNVQFSNLSNNTMTSTSSNYGGALFAENLWRVQYSTLNGNRLGDDGSAGGAIAAFGSGFVLLSSFSNNYAKAFGGAIATLSGTTTVERASFRYNEAATASAVGHFGSGSLRLMASAIGDNGTTATNQCFGTTSADWNVSDDASCLGAPDDLSMNPGFVGTASPPTSPTLQFISDVITIGCASPGVDHFPVGKGTVAITDPLGTTLPQGPENDSGAMEVTGCS